MQNALPHYIFSPVADVALYLFKEINALKSCSQLLKLKLTVIHDPQVQDDLKVIENCYENMEKRVQELKLKTLNLEETFCSQFRHDMRSEIGTLMGYNDLILESLNPLQQVIIRPLVEDIGVRSLALLPSIEKIDFESDKSLVSENKEIQKNLDEVSTILIIDDLSDKRELFARRLSQAGHQVLLAESGQKGLDLLNSQKVDLILLDILMPEMVGEDVLKIIKSNPKTHPIPVLIISSMGDTDRLAACITAGADDYIPFSINPVLFRARIQVCLEKKKAYDRDQEHQAELDQTRHLLHMAIQSINDGFVVYDAQDKIVLCNQKFTDLYDYKPCKEETTYEDFLRTNLTKNLYNFNEKKSFPSPKLFSSDKPQEWLSDRLKNHIDPQAPYLELLSQGDWLEITENLIPGGGVVALHKVVTQDVEKRNRMSYLADHDSLTKLFNRRAFEKALQESQTHFETSQESFALLYLDLDGFKSVNDTYGHAWGDLLLQTISDSLKNSVRSTDIVARLGGDEFSIILSNMSCKKHVTMVVERILTAVGNTFIHEGKEISFGLSLGAALYPQDGRTLIEVRKKADQAMYQAKRSLDISLCFASDL